MGIEKNLLYSLPRSVRNISERIRTKDPEVTAISQNFGREYFDGDRMYGYGGYTYDGRWLPVAKTLVQEYSLGPSMKVLDVGCAKGFLVKDLIITCPGLEVYGLDISKYALMNAEPEIIDRLQMGNATNLPFPDKFFDLVVSINTLHNLDRDQVGKALTEIQRVTKKNSYVVVDSYRNNSEKEVFESWVLTAKFHDFPENWIKLFAEVGYTGDYYWTIINKNGENE